MTPTALDFLIAGRASDAIEAYLQILDRDPNSRSAVDGLASAYMCAGQYDKAIPLKWRVHKWQKAETPDHPGQQLQIACSHWCLGEHSRAMALVHELCMGIIDQTIGMSPDMAGGATFGLILHYMAVTARDDSNVQHALNYFTRLNEQYEQRPNLFRFPKETVRQILGLESFEDVLQATSARDLTSALIAASENRSVKAALVVALFQDGVLQRVENNEVRCMARMSEVFELGYQANALRWCLSRYERTKK